MASSRRASRYRVALGAAGHSWAHTTARRLRARSPVAQQDGEVADAHAADLAILLCNWGPNAGHPADFNGDGMVNAADLAVLLGTWGPCV